MQTDIAKSITLSLSREDGTSSIALTPLATLVCLAVSDMLAVFVSLSLASGIRESVVSGQVTPVFRIFVPTSALILCCFTAARLYPGVSENPVIELRQCVRATVLSFLFLWSATYFFHDLTQSRVIFFLAAVISAVCVPLCRSLTRSAFANQKWWGCPVAIIGFGETGKRIFSTLTKNAKAGLKVVAVLDDNPNQLTHLADPVIRGPLSRCLEIAQEHRISYAIVCMPDYSRHELLRMLDRYGHCFGHVMVVPDLVGMASLGVAAREIGGVVGLEVTRQLLRPSAQFTKRTLDLVVSALLAPVLAPAMMLVAAFIRLESPGPVFFGNRRIGRGGKVFTAWKFRSMVADGDAVLRAYLEAHPEERDFWKESQKLRRDPRVTRVGRVIRKLSLDELPQLWNVIRGDMSLVGPRPCLEHQVALYGKSFELYKMVRPGITGLWQVSGRNKLTFSERVQMDAYTIQNWSVWLDIYILARTVSVVLTANGAY